MSLPSRSKASALLMFLFLPLEVFGQYAFDGRDETEEVRIADTFHIMVNDQQMASRLHDEIVSVKEAERLKKFKQVARRSSIDPGSASAGGDLGSVHEGQMTPEFEKAIFNSKANRVTGPFKSAFGWHLSYVTGFRTKKVAEICYPPLKAAYDSSANPTTKAALGLGLAAIERDTLPQKISPLLGKEWSGLLMDEKRNLMYVRKALNGATKPLQVVEEHTEYITGKLIATTKPMGCARSMRVRIVIDCDKRSFAFSSSENYEGRVASGRKLFESRINAENLKFHPLTTSNNSGFSLEGFACSKPD